MNLRCRQNKDEMLGRLFKDLNSALKAGVESICTSSIM